LEIGKCIQALLAGVFLEAFDLGHGFGQYGITRYKTLLGGNFVQKSFTKVVTLGRDSGKPNHGGFVGLYPRVPGRQIDGIVDETRPKTGRGSDTPIHSGE